MSVDELVRRVAAVGRQPDRVIVNPDLLPLIRAQRDRDLNALGPRPPWWRIFARRAWECSWRAIMDRTLFLSEAVYVDERGVEHIVDLLGPVVL